MADPYALKDLTVPRVLARQAHKFGPKVFITDLVADRSLTYLELDGKSSQAANALASIGARFGDHAAVFMDNSIDFLVCFFGLGKLGAVVVPVNTAARGNSLAYFLNQSDSKFLLLDAALWGRVEEILHELPNIQHFVVVGDAALVPTSYPVPHSMFGPLMARHSDTPQSLPVACSDLLMLAYTSGTSGPSKGCMVSHAAAFAYGTGFIDVHRYRESDVFYVCLPLFHGNALLAAVGSAILAGASVALSRRFSVSRFWDDIRKSGATITNLLGSMSSFLWSQPPRDDDVDNSLKLVSMSPTPKWAAGFQSRFGLKVMSNYGLSDFGMATAYTVDSPEEKFGSIGKLRPGIQMRIVDDWDFELPNGEIGEIVLRHDEPWRASTGYYNMPEATAKANRNLWFHTGDRGYRDADGFYYFVDRKKDCIRRRGENISSFEVEQAIMGHASVADVAVFPLRIEGNDEEVAAVIVLKPESHAEEVDIIRHCEKNMAYFMVPRFIQFRDAMPLTANNKIEKFKLQHEAENRIGRFWDRVESGVTISR